jgi:ABC-type branched-subunit amino acid transport system ATPase component
MSKKSSEITLPPSEEAARYLENARQILSEKARKDEGEYKDIKYVKMASGTAYSAALLILDEYLKQKEGLNYTKPKTIEDYTSRVRKYDKKLLALLLDAYDELHINGYYIGTRSVNTIQRGLEHVTRMLNYI